MRGMWVFGLGTSCDIQSGFSIELPFTSAENENNCQSYVVQGQLLGIDTNWCSVASWVVEIYAWSIIWNFFWPHTASSASDKKGAKIQHEFWWFCQKIFFSKYQNKVLEWLSSRIWKTLKSSGVIFKALETSSAYLTSAASATSAASTASKCQFLQK